MEQRKEDSLHTFHLRGVPSASPPSALAAAPDNDLTAPRLAARHRFVVVPGAVCTSVQARTGAPRDAPRVLGSCSQTPSVVGRLPPGPVDPSPGVRNPDCESYHRAVAARLYRSFMASGGHRCADASAPQPAPTALRSRAQGPHASTDRWQACRHGAFDLTWSNR